MQKREELKDDPIVKEAITDVIIHVTSVIHYFSL